MENASKALIIAGAILISILLITLGIIVYNGSRSTIDESMGSMDETTISMTNSKISQYTGNNVSSTQIRALVNQINTANKVNKAGITIKFKSSGGASFSNVTDDSNIETGKTYKVTIPDSAYNSQGLIKEVQIEANS